MEQIRQEIDLLFPELVKLRHTLHEHPEPGTQEFVTDKIITDCLEKWEIPYRIIADTGILAVLTGETPDTDAPIRESGDTNASGTHTTGSANRKCARVVGLRADIDALPIEEPRTHACRSKNPGMMHACGHDAHTAIQLGTARILQLHKKEWSGTVKLFFQPAEETIGGAQRMIQAECMLNPTVDYVAGLHVMPQYHTGQIEIKYGKLNASSDEVLIDVYGKGAHGAYPDQGVDAIVIASQLILSLQSLVSRAISPLNSAVLSFGKIVGGTAGNIICDHVVLGGTLRTLDPETREAAKQYITAQAGSIAAAYRGSAKVTFHSGYDALINDDALTALVEETASDLLGREHIFYKEYPSLGVEDFSFFQKAARAGVFYHLGCTRPDQKEIHPLHTASFEVDDDCLKIGILLQYTLTRRLLTYTENSESDQEL